MGGIFELFGDALDGMVKAPGKILEAGAEAVTRIPEVGIKAVEGLVKGIEKGVEKVGDAFDKVDGGF